MKNRIRSIFRPIFRIVPDKLRDVYYQWADRRINLRIFLDWEKRGRPSPPPHIVKQETIKELREKYGYRTLVETGTFMGDMIKAQLSNFNKIYSIELGKELWENAVKRFEGNSHVVILQGDSGHVLKNLMPKLDAPCIFWLDGHYSEGITAKGEKECPVYEELQAIFTSPLNHVLLIDDARRFNGIGDYPGIKELSEFILSHKPDSLIEIKHDIIRIECK